MWIERSPEMPALLLMCMMLGLSRGAPVHQQQRKPAIASQSGGGDSCVAALAKACGTKRSDVFACAECAGTHQQALKAAGCGNDAIAAWCAGVACPAGEFRSSVNESFCPELTRAAGATTMEACRELCCSNATCGVWEWCPDSTPGCGHWAGARCHIGPAPTGPCPWASHWVGETRADLPPPPPTPGPPGPHPPHGPPAPPASPSGPPATRKQGFSGFLGPDFSCGDAAALGLSDSWCAPGTAPPISQSKRLAGAGITRG